ncbi:hypothetical protein HD806DRAFT_418354 [Xylariaceae sp. AK1471]|nr:hypothetical protein HD806DRAFT_418354 [Xylariaceae sp. AK1471]
MCISCWVRLATCVARAPQIIFLRTRAINTTITLANSLVLTHTHLLSHVLNLTRFRVLLFFVLSLAVSGELKLIIPYCRFTDHSLFGRPTHATCRNPLSTNHFCLLGTRLSFHTFLNPRLPSFSSSLLTIKLQDRATHNVYAC